jgi:hypothetical protein
VGSSYGILEALYGYEGASSSVSDVEGYYVYGYTKLLDLIFNILLVFIRRWKIRTFLHRGHLFRKVGTEGMMYRGSRSRWTLTNYCSYFGFVCNDTVQTDYCKN